MNKSMGWSFYTEAHFFTVAAWKAEGRVSAVLLMHFPDKQAEEIMLFWEGRCPYMASSVDQYESLLLAIVIQKTWKRVRENLVLV